MARGTQNMNDQLFRTRGRNAAEPRETQEDIRRRQIRSWIILVCVVLAVVLGIHFLGRYGKGKEIGMAKLPCYAYQNVTPFRDGTTKGIAPVAVCSLARSLSHFSRKRLIS